MSCICCTEYAARIINLLRDEELKEKFEEVTEIKVSFNMFICDPCSLKCIEAFTLKQNCNQNYNKLIESIKVEPPVNTYEETDTNFKLDEVQQDFVFEEEEHLEEHLEEEEQHEDTKHEDSLIRHSDEDTEIPENPRIRYCYTLQEKINAIKVAEVYGNRKAGKLLSIGESCIRKWRQQKQEIREQENISGKKRVMSKVDDPVGENVNFEAKSVISHIELNEQIVNCIVSKEVKARKSYTSAEKLSAIATAESSSNRQAAKLYKIDESCIRKWRSQKNMLEELDRERGTKRKPNLRFPEIDVRLKEFVNNKVSQGIIPRPNEIRMESIRIAKNLDMKHFKGTSSYVFKFMERNKIPSRKCSLKNVQ